MISFEMKHKNDDVMINVMINVCINKNRCWFLLIFDKYSLNS